MNNRMFITRIVTHAAMTVVRAAKRDIEGSAERGEIPITIGVAAGIVAGGLLAGFGGAIVGAIAGAVLVDVLNSRKEVVA